MRQIVTNRWTFLLLALAACAEWSLPVEAADAKPIEWHTDYAKAMRVAKAQQKMLLVYFRGAGANAIRDRFETTSLRDGRVLGLLERFVSVKLPLDAQIVVKGQATTVLRHAAFEELHGREGLAIIDFVNAGQEQYGHVVTALPLVGGKFYTFRPEHLAEALDLPAGTLTQRTLVFAVRIHPESPASTRGEIDPNLMAEARSHSHHQARIRVQGHHNWAGRFPRLSRLLPRGLRAQEVVAESWPHETLVDAAVDCVDSWRHSSGHWSAVRSSQPRFGYDMKRGSNGIWYATGLFGNNN